MQARKLFCAMFFVYCFNGCAAEKKMAETRVQYFEDTVPKFDAVQDSFFELADKMVRGRFQERRAVAKQQMDTWWREHTTDVSTVTMPNSEVSPLTSMPADYIPTGVVFEWNKTRTKRFPIRAEAMMAQMDAYAKAMAQTDKDEGVWDALCREYKSIRDPFRKITTKQQVLEKDYADTQKRMEEFSQHVMATSVGLGAAAGIIGISGGL